MEFSFCIFKAFKLKKTSSLCFKIHGKSWNFKIKRKNRDVIDFSAVVTMLRKKCKIHHIFDKFMESCEMHVVMVMGSHGILEKRNRKIPALVSHSCPTD